jgi:hypothetical protein
MKTGRTGAAVLMETRGANQQGAGQASSHLWLGCLTFAWDDRLAWFAHDGAGISPRVAVPQNKAGKMCGQWPRIDARTGRFPTCSMTSQTGRKEEVCVVCRMEMRNILRTVPRLSRSRRDTQQGRLTWPPRQHPARSWASQGCFAMLVGVQRRNGRPEPTHTLP